MVEREVTVDGGVDGVAFDGAGGATVVADVRVAATDIGE